ncbi:hypothetical protein NEAUS04_0828 [Nematocida ausubeli]|uniref:Uncharacterized protein n=1 Tax=Nematocida ausubeli (strain ATCC PRA-371 / ERTm2) TaxID=1913371 RepID=H8Z9W4_NEMA1|nr:uncharacterized protein NESG_00721 [Nematocida ausubeli]EHY66745.1 hypothetical protein NERG_00385 [Nematocida ausubeli]KAI5133495.1 hypothetical protein NEAUS06_0583 [Nematocida ausubeli]KAI5133706.1 hypothetical protein NEAUS07_0537 [Nematocida ausubeli]KAI5147271.1 hypothetical protein NEAUS05_0585 [Nematocida ausubeli]KAI5162008.1 hypothetical protein NEAUS04_0828 [Nematocida ausubeli]
MDTLRKFLRVKRKSEYITDIGKIKITKRDKRKINRFKNNQSVGPFVIERPNLSVFVCDTRSEPLISRVTTEEVEETLRRQKTSEKIFLEKHKRRHSRRRKETVEDLEDLWGDQSGNSENMNRKLSRKTERPKDTDAYDQDDLNLRTDREGIWKHVHFYKDSIRRPRVYQAELEGLYKKLSPIKVKVPADTEIPTKTYTDIVYKENLRDVTSMACGIYYIAVHSSSVSIRDADGYMPIRNVKLVTETEDVLIRCAYLSPDESKLAIITFGHGVIICATDRLLNSSNENETININKISQENPADAKESASYEDCCRVFPDKTFRKGAWHRRSIYFAGILHGKVVIINTKQKKAVVFYKGTQNIQHVEFHPTKSILIMMAPSCILFYGLSTKRKDSKKTIYHITAANTLSISLGTETMYIGTATSQVQIFQLTKEFDAKFIRAIYTQDTPKRISLHKKYGYAAVFDGSPTFLVYGNGSNTTLPPMERAGAIHKYTHPYRSGIFHETHPKAHFTLSNKLNTLYPEYNPVSSAAIPAS